LELTCYFDVHTGIQQQILCLKTNNNCPINVSKYEEKQFSENANYFYELKASHNKAPPMQKIKTIKIIIVIIIIKRR